MSDNNYFLKGALIGCAVGGLAGLMAYTKAGEKLTQDICDGCESIKHTGEEFTENLRKKGESILHMFDQEEPEDHSFLIGGAIGAVVAALATLLLAPQSGKKLRHTLGNKYEDLRDQAEDFIHTVNKKGHYVAEEFEDWKDFLSTIVEKLSGSSRGKHKNHWHLQEILDYAKIGLQLFEQLKK